jgi:hypothetical protein
VLIVVVMMSEEKVETAASANFFAEPQHQAVTPSLNTNSLDDIDGSRSNGIASLSLFNDI